MGFCKNPTPFFALFNCPDERGYNMFIKLLTDDEIKTCLDGITKDTFKNGAKSQPIEGIKKNKESLGVPEDIRKIIINKIYDAHYIDSVYCPTRVSVNYYNQYKKGDYYNLHVDNFKAYPKSNNVHFDYGFSINLNDDYEGGEIYFNTEVGTIGRKLKAGEAAIFPITYTHGVQEVTKGLRTNVLGWFSSNISYEQSFILKNVYEVNQHLSKDSNSIFVKSVLIQNYLKKEWGK